MNRLTLRTKLGFGIGDLGGNLFFTIMGFYLLYFFTDVVGMLVPHEPGGLCKALQILSANHITIDYMYAFAINNSASVIIRSSSNEDVIRVLQKNKMSLLKVSDLYKI